MQRIFTKREKLIFYITAGVIIFTLGFNFLLAPILNKNAALNKEVNFYRAKLKKYLWLLTQKDKIRAKYSKFSSDIKLSGSQEDSLVSAFSELENLANASGIKIIDLRPQKKDLIDLRTEGSMEGYLKFIYNLENSLSLLRIKTFRLTAKPNSSILEGSFSVSRPFIE